MPNAKKIAVPAAFGFALSFLISLVSTGNFGRSLLRGMIFALVFGALFFAIDFVYTRFLDDGRTVSVGNDSKKSQVRSGSRIDITLSDDELSDDGQNLKFPVAKNRHGLNEEDKKEFRPEPEQPSVQHHEEAVSEPVVQEVPVQPSAAASVSSPVVPEPKVSSVQEKPSASAQENAFKPVQLGTPLNVPAAEETKAAPKKAFDRAAELDDLPEINDFVPDIGSVTSSEPVIEDSEFAGSSSSSSSGISSGGSSKATEHDVATLAKAIQTVLKKDE